VEVTAPTREESTMSESTPMPDHVIPGEGAPDPVVATAPTAPPAPDDETGLDAYIDKDQPAVMPVGGMAAGTVPRAPRDAENK